jgi:hypothetical protein
MQRFYTPILVASVMVIGILGITNPGFRQPYKLFDNVEGKLTHNYFVFSVYEQYNGYSVTSNGKYTVYRRFIGIALNFFEISPLRVEEK